MIRYYNDTEKGTKELLEFAVSRYVAKNKDELGILTVITEQLGFKSYPTQSMFNEDVTVYLNDKEHALTVIYNEYLDEEEIKTIKGE